MADIAPELYKRIAKDFNEKVAASEVLDGLVLKIKRSGTQSDVTEYAEVLGEIASHVMKRHLKLSELPNETLYWNIAQRIISPVLTNVYEKVNGQSIIQMRRADVSRGLSLGIAKGMEPESRIKQVLEFAVNCGTQEELDNALSDPVITVARKFQDDFLKVNAEIRTNMGFNPVVIRKYDGKGLHGGKTPCTWCISREGTYDYKTARSQGAFQRHPGCGCYIEVDFPDHVDVQTNWVNNTWTTI